MLIRPWTVLKVQAKELLRGLWHFAQQETYTNHTAFKPPFRWLAWRVEYLCIIRRPITGQPVVVYMKPGAEQQVRQMQAACDRHQHILNVIAR